MVICLQQSADDLHMVQLMPLPPIISCFIRIQNGSAFLISAYHGCPGKRRLNGCLNRVLLARDVAVNDLLCVLHDIEH